MKNGLQIQDNVIKHACRQPFEDCDGWQTGRGKLFMSNDGNLVDSKSSTGTGKDRAPRLLIVDDQVGMTKVISAAAAEFGLEIREVNDATLATQAFIDFRPDILILDLIMPEKDGLDVLNEVLVIDPSVKLILISGYGATYLKLGDAVSKFHRDAPVEVLHKPFRAGVLRQVLAGMVSG